MSGKDDAAIAEGAAREQSRAIVAYLEARGLKKIARDVESNVPIVSTRSSAPSWHFDAYGREIRVGDLVSSTCDMCDAEPGPYRVTSLVRGVEMDEGCCNNPTAHGLRVVTPRETSASTPSEHPGDTETK